jgi:hypothetical protein
MACVTQLSGMCCGQEWGLLKSCRTRHEGHDFPIPMMSYNQPHASWWNLCYQPWLVEWLVNWSLLLVWKMFVLGMRGRGRRWLLEINGYCSNSLLPGMAGPGAAVLNDLNIRQCVFILTPHLPLLLNESCCLFLSINLFGFKYSSR